MTKTALYRHFDKSGRLLYVGISKNPMSRMGKQIYGAEWFYDIAQMAMTNEAGG